MFIIIKTLSRFGSRHVECYVTKLVPGPYQLFLPNQTTRTPSSFNMKSMSKEREKNRVILKLGLGKVGGGCILKTLIARGGGGTNFI